MLCCWLLRSVSAAHLIDEYAVKAAFLYNFAKFVEWPAQAFADDFAPFRVCIAGKDPFGEALRIMDDTLVHERAIAVRRVPLADDLADCQIVFVSGSESSRVQSILAKLENRPVLTVSDIEGFAVQGGMIDLFNENQKIRFEINLKAVQGANLKISSHLLKLARVVGNPE